MFPAEVGLKVLVCQPETPSAPCHAALANRATHLIKASNGRGTPSRTAVTTSCDVITGVAPPCLPPSTGYKPVSGPVCARGTSARRRGHRAPLLCVRLTPPICPHLLSFPPHSVNSLGIRSTPGEGAALGAPLVPSACGCPFVRLSLGDCQLFGVGDCSISDPEPRTA